MSIRLLSALLVSSGALCEPATAASLGTPSPTPSTSPSVIEAERPPPTHRAFDVAPVTFGADGQHSLGKWSRSTDTNTDAEVDVLVIASWCPYSVQALEKLADDPLKASRFDFILVYESEFRDAIEMAARDGEIEPAQKQALLKHGEDNRIFLVEPDKLARTRLKFSATRSERFNDVVDSFPTALTCNAGGCRNNPELRP